MSNAEYIQGTGIAGTPAGEVLTIQGDPAGTPIPVSATITPSGTQDTNLKEVNGATVNVGVGAAGTGTQRVTTSTDSTIATITNPVTVVGSGTAGTANSGVLTVQGIASMTKLLVTPDSVALPANQSVNVSQVNATTVLTGAGAVGTGTQRIAVGADISTIAGSAPGTAGSASANVLTVQGIASATPIIIANSASTPFLANALTNTAGGVTVVNAAATLMSYYCYNPNSTVAYVQIFDAASVTLGTTPPKWSIGIPPGAAANISGLNHAFTNSIKVAATTTATGASAPSTALDCNFGYR